MGSKVCETVVVAVVRLPSLPLRLVCEKSVCGGLVLVLGEGLVAEETGRDWAGDGDGIEVEVGISEGWSCVSKVLLPSRERRGLPAVMMVSTD